LPFAGSAVADPVPVGEGVEVGDEAEGLDGVAAEVVGDAVGDVGDADGTG